MKSLLAIACLILISIQPITAQRRSRSSNRQQNITSGPAATLYLSGKVVLSDATPLTEPVLIQSICRGQNRNETHTDSQGNFSFQFGDRLSSAAEAGSDADSSLDTRASSRSAGNDPQDCDLQASLAGFLSDRVQLNGRVNGSGNIDIGRIVLHRIANVEGLTISGTTAAAPGSARKALAKGQDEKKKGNWEEAQKLFEKAVRVYPKFAVAWFELGNVQMEHNDATAAHHSFEQSIAADDKYINPYRGLMQLALHAQSWPEVIEASDKLLALNPINFPDAWFDNGVGHFCLQNFVAAEKSARRGLAIDPIHQVPKLEYLLGMVLMKMNNFAESTRHFDAYLHLVTSPRDVAEAQKQLDEVARLSAQAAGIPVSK